VDAVWRLVLREAIHGDSAFDTIAGPALVDRVGAEHGLRPYSRVAVLGAGRGALCRHLAARYGCVVTGVERDPVAAAAARELLDRLPAPVRRRVTVATSPLGAWQPSHPYDLVVGVESLPRGGLLTAVLDTAYLALRARGQLALLDLFGGPDRGPADDGPPWMFSRPLPSPAVLADRLGRSGFANVATHDRTDEAVEWLHRVRRALVSRRREVAAAGSGEVAARWLHGTGARLADLRAGRLSYWQVTAVRPGPARAADFELDLPRRAAGPRQTLDPNWHRKPGEERRPAEGRRWEPATAPSPAARSTTGRGDTPGPGLERAAPGPAGGSGG